MLILEIIIISLLALSIVLRSIPSVSKGKHLLFLPLAACLVLTSHQLLYGHTWQLIPLLVYAPFLLVINSLHYLKRIRRAALSRRKWLRIAALILLSILFIGSSALPMLLPARTLPAPKGPFPVGISSLLTCDQNRQEVFTADSSDRRCIALEIWYPAEPLKRVKPSSYWDPDHLTGSTYSRAAGMPSFWYTHLSKARTNSYRDAPLSSLRKSYPVIIYSHSFCGLNSENTMLCEELASQGYIVCSIAHSYESVLALFPDGTAIPGDLEHFNSLFHAHAEEEEAFYEAYQKSVREEDKEELVRRILKIDDQATQLLKERTMDVSLTLDKLDGLSLQQGMFKGKLDLERAGIMGWSFGGATALEACLSDPRLTAGINIDGNPYGQNFNEGNPISRPYMLINNGSLDEVDRCMAAMQYDRMEGPGCILTIEGSQHLNFYDFPYLFRIYRLLDFWGPIKPLRMLELERVFIRGFFDQYLKGESTAFTDLTSGQYPEVSLKSK